MLEVYKLLASIIEPICTCFVDHFPEGDTKSYPYCEIKFPNVLSNNSFSDINLLEINIWHNKGTDINSIEGIADSIHAALNNYQYTDSVLGLFIKKDEPYRLSLPDPAIHIQRRQMRYIVKIYYL